MGGHGGRAVLCVPWEAMVCDLLDKPVLILLLGTPLFCRLVMYWRAPAAVSGYPVLFLTLETEVIEMGFSAKSFLELDQVSLVYALYGKGIRGCAHLLVSPNYWPYLLPYDLGVRREIQECLFFPCRRDYSDLWQIYNWKVGATPISLLDTACKSSWPLPISCFEKRLPSVSLVVCYDMIFNLFLQGVHPSPLYYRGGVLLTCILVHKDPVTVLVHVFWPSPVPLSIVYHGNSKCVPSNRTTMLFSYINF